jgi:hypothetical protein
MIAVTVYVLCFLTSATCAVLLGRGYARWRAPLLLWSAFGFAGFALNNAGVFFDLVIVPEVDYSVWRKIPAIVGVAAFVYGLVWESK